MASNQELPFMRGSCEERRRESLTKLGSEALQRKLRRKKLDFCSHIEKKKLED